MSQPEPDPKPLSAEALKFLISINFEDNDALHSKMSKAARGLIGQGTSRENARMMMYGIILTQAMLLDSWAERTQVIDALVAMVPGWLDTPLPSEHYPDSNV